LIGFHRRMASSIKALAASLENVAARLRHLQAGLRSDDTLINVLQDLEDETSELVRQCFFWELLTGVGVG
jgi:hypothetical protein